MLFRLRQIPEQGSRLTHIAVSMASSKRPNAESKRKGKRQKSGGGGGSSSDAAAGGVVFRMLCPATRIGGVIGKGGGIISQIRQETGVNIKIDEPTPGCDERVIIFSGSEKENGEDNVDKEKDKEKEKEASNDETESKGKGDEEEEAEEKGGDNDDVEDKEVEDSQGEKANSNSVIHSAIRKALSLVFDRMVEGVEDTADGDEESGKASSFVFRLLILSNQVGCLLGKGGSVIKKMSAESGAQIRILPKDKLPVCASASDEIVQVNVCHSLKLPLIVLFQVANVESLLCQMLFD